MIDSAVKFLKDRFGIVIPEEYGLMDRGDIWIVARDVLDFDERIRVNRYGIRLIRVFKKGMKLTTSGAQVIGYLATKNVVHLEKWEDVVKLVEGGNVVGQFPVEKGQVIVKYGKDIIGIALYDGVKLKSQIPSSRRIGLKRE